MSNSKPSLDSCRCCKGIELMTPADNSNDHGLATLLYRVGTHGKFKESMLRRLSESPVLKELTTRENDDFTIALFDVWAVILDVLTFYSERIINEGYILTSVERLSLVELARHISYIPKPGVAAGTWLSFLTEESPGAPKEAKLPVGTRVQSIPGQDEKAQIFETIEKIQAKTKWNEIRPKLRRTQTLGKGSTSLYLQGTDIQLFEGDQILIVGNARLTYTGSEQWDIRTVQSLIVNDDSNYTKVTWRDGLGHEQPTITPSSEVKVYVFRQRAALFGYNAPDYRNMAEEVKKSFYGPDGPNLKNWKNFKIKNPERNTIYLDAIYPKILKGSWLALVKPLYKELYRVSDIKPDSQKDYSLASKSSQVILDTREHLSWFPLRETVVFAQSEELELAKAPIMTPVFGIRIQLDKNYPELLEEQKLVVSGELTTHLQVTERKIVVREDDREYIDETPLFFNSNGNKEKLNSGTKLEVIGVPERNSETEVKWHINYKGKEGYVIAGEGDLISYVEIKDPNIVEPPTSMNQPVIVSELVEIDDLESPDTIVLDFPLKNVYQRHTVKIYANVAQATHGETKTEILGSGNAAIPFQRFGLKQKPLTYVSSSSASGVATTLEVRVDDILWQEVPTFYNRTSEERIYITRAEDDGTTYVQFGNGITGARLSTGIENIVAKYRVGIGLEGDLKENQLSMLMDPQLGVKSVKNPMPTSGAEDPESIDNIRRNAPLTVLSLERIVSVMDFENFTSAFSGIGKARADLLWKGEDRIIHLTVASAIKGAIDSTLEENLVNGINSARHNNFPVMVNSFEEKLFNVKAKIKIHPVFLPEKVIAQVKEDLIKAYNFESRSFGQDVTPSELIAIIQGVEGVVAVDLDELGGQDPFTVEHFRLISKVARWESTLVKPAELLLIDENNMDITSMDP